MSVTGRCWVCPECHWTEFYDGVSTDTVFCLGEHRDVEMRCVEYVPVDQLTGAVKERDELRLKVEELHIECGVLAGNLTACRREVERLQGRQ